MQFNLRHVLGVVFVLVLLFIVQRPFTWHDHILLHQYQLNTPLTAYVMALVVFVVSTIVLFYIGVYEGVSVFVALLTLFQPASIVSHIPLIVTIGLLVFVKQLRDLTFPVLLFSLLLSQPVKAIAIALFSALVLYTIKFSLKSYTRMVELLLAVFVVVVFLFYQTLPFPSSQLQSVLSHCHVTQGLTFFGDHGGQCLMFYKPFLYNTSDVLLFKREKNGTVVFENKRYVVFANGVNGSLFFERVRAWDKVKKMWINVEPTQYSLLFGDYYKGVLVLGNHNPLLNVSGVVDVFTDPHYLLIKVRT